MPLRRAVERGDTSRTFHPPRHLKIARGLIELCRVVPVMCSAALAVLVVGQLMTIQAGAGFVVAAVLAGPLLLAAGVVAACVTTAMKWLLVGRFGPVEHPLWSSFVWRNELADTFVEVLAVPWLVGHAARHPRPHRVAAEHGREHRARRVAARRTGCPSPTSCDSATGPRSTGAVSCRPTCSMIGS